MRQRISRRQRIRSLLLPGFLTLLAGALLVGLGVWQLHRLAWKEGILAQIESRARQAPQPVPLQSDWSLLAPKDYEYRRVSLDGTFRNDLETLVFRGGESGPGYLVMTPLALQSGGTVIVNRGYVPDTMKDKATRKAAAPTGVVHVVGLMREPEPRNFFTPPDEPAKNQFFTRDPHIIAAHAGLLDVAPFTVDADATPNPGGWPRGGATQLAIPNNHLSYALTWFGLAIGLLGVFLAFAWHSLTENEEAHEREAQPARIEVR